MKIKHAKLWQAVKEGDKIPRKAKKYLLGKRMPKCKLKLLLDSVVVHECSTNMYERPNITPHLFCPKCGCSQHVGTGNMTSYPEHYEHFHCMRCRYLVAYIDNSPYIHCLEYREHNYELN